MKRKFKAGDKVFAMENSAWGLEPMVVVESKHSVVECKHPSLGAGCFSPQSLEFFTFHRQELLDMLNCRIKIVNDMKAELFEKGN